MNGYEAMSAATEAWGGPAVTRVVHAEVVALPASIMDPEPDGAVQMQWTDAPGYVHTAHVVKWWRLDQQGLCRGVPVRVDVQARQRRDMSCPPHHVSADLVVTGNAEDKAQVMIGDPDRAGSWAYGITFHGAVLNATSVWVD